MITILSVLVVAMFSVFLAYTLAIVIGAIRLWFASRKERAAMEQRVDEAIARHPAGTCWVKGPNPLLDTPIRPGADTDPFSARTVCGHLIYGDSLGDLLTNEIYHFSVCQLPDRKDSAA